MTIFPEYLHSTRASPTRRAIIALLTSVQNQEEFEPEDIELLLKQHRDMTLGTRQRLFATPEIVRECSDGHKQINFEYITADVISNYRSLLQRLSYIHEACAALNIPYRPSHRNISNLARKLYPEAETDFAVTQETFTPTGKLILVMPDYLSDLTQGTKQLPGVLRTLAIALNDDVPFNKAHISGLHISRKRLRALLPRELGTSLNTKIATHTPTKTLQHIKTYAFVTAALELLGIEPPEPSSKFDKAILAQHPAAYADAAQALGITNPTPQRPTVPVVSSQLIT